MTYVVGIRDGNSSAIICDSRVMFGSGTPGLNSALKSGILFPGCHYAAVGEAAPMRLFVTRLKTFLTGRNTPQDFWNRFCAYTKTYDRFDADRPFTLLLMSRHTGRSTFYLLDSAVGSVQEQGDLVTLGSGRSLLDPVIAGVQAERHAAIREYLADQKAPEWFFAHYYCLALMEHAQGDAYDALNRVGVGGVFHFSYQTPMEDHRQHPAVYVVVSGFVEQKVISYTLYRVTFEEMALVVENGAEKSFSISIDEASWPAITRLGTKERSELAQRLQDGSLNQPFYNFLGLGFGSPKFRGNWLIDLNLGANKYALSRAAINNAVITNFAQGCLTGELQAEVSRALRS